MHKGEKVEEGDHDSLMRTQRTYFGLVEQQSLRQAEEEEQLKFEQEGATTMLLSEQSNLEPLNVKKHRGSTIVSLSPSILAQLYGKKDLIEDDNLNEEDDEERIKTTKVINKKK
jgi:hypothetical protein